MKMLVTYLDVILPFVSKPNTFISPNFRYLEIIGFNRIDFMCFGYKGIVGIYSAFHNEVVIFLFADNF